MTKPQPRTAHGLNPSYGSLRERTDQPAGSAWGVFGHDDELGTLNRLSTEGIINAARLVTTGSSFPLSWDFDLPSPPMFGRETSVQHVVDHPTGGKDDYFDKYWPQSSSQWDALAHIRHPQHGRYNGFPEASMPGNGGTRLGIHNVGRRGIVGRFVLVDVAGYRSRRGQSFEYSASTAVTAAELDDVLAAQGTSLASGDIVLIRFGWTEWYESLTQTAREELASARTVACPGLSRTDETLEWLWDNEIAAVAADNPAIEVMPFDLDAADGFLHYRIIPLLGFALGELFSLGDLARHAAEIGRYDGLFVAAPFTKIGGVGSPANAIAIQ